MLAFRITKRAYADLGGLGGRYADGRWHTRPRRVVYLGSSLALASLEILVNLDLPGHLLPRDYVAMRVELPDDLSMMQVESANLPADWRLKERRFDCQALGNDWLDRAETAVLIPPRLSIDTWEPRVADQGAEAVWRGGGGIPGIAAGLDDGVEVSRGEALVAQSSRRPRAFRSRASSPSPSTRASWRCLMPPSGKLIKEISA